MNRIKKDHPLLGLDVIEHTDAMLAYWDKDKICRFANNAYISWFGKTPEEMIDQITMEELLGPLYEKNRYYIEKALNGEVQVFERDIPLPSGEIRRTIATYRPNIIKGETKGFFVHVADITPIKWNASPKSEHPLGNVLAVDPLDKVVTTLTSYLLTGFPGISALAKIHNVSASKLKRDFQLRFNKGLFSYFRKMQMEVAYNYLEGNKCTRKQAASMLNFSNPSNFSQCYNKYLQEKKAEELLENLHKANDERYRLFIAQSPYAIAMVDNKLRYLAASEKWLSDYDLTEEDILGKNHDDIFPNWNERWKKICEEALKGNGQFCEEEFFLGKDGTPNYIKWDVRPWYNTRNGIGGILFMMENITAATIQKAENKKLLEIWERTSEIARIGAWKRNFITNEGLWSKITRQIIEVPDDLVPTIDFAINVYKEGKSRDIAKSVLKAAIEKGIPFDIEVDIITWKGNEKRVRVVGYPVFSNGICEKLLGIFQELKK